MQDCRLLLLFTRFDLPDYHLHQRTLSSSWLALDPEKSVVLVSWLAFHPSGILRLMKAPFTSAVEAVRYDESVHLSQNRIGTAKILQSKLGSHSSLTQGTNWDTLKFAC